MTFSVAQPWARWAFDRLTRRCDTPPPAGALPVEAIRAWRVEALVHAALADARDPRAAPLRDVAWQAAAANLLRRAELPSALASLDEVRAPYVLYKGAATVHLHPELTAWRAVSDADVLVRVEDFERARSCLAAAGFAEVRNTEPVSIAWNNERVFVRRGSRPELHIDLHCGVHRRFVFSELSRAMVDHALRVDGIWVPLPCHRLLGIAVHRLKHGYFADARELLDFHVIAESMDERALHALVDEADRHGAGPALWIAWDRARAWFGPSHHQEPAYRALAGRLAHRLGALRRLTAVDGPTLADKPWRRAPFLQLYAPLLPATALRVRPFVLAAAHVLLRAADVAVAGPDAVGHFPARLRGPVDAARRLVLRA